MNVDRLLTSGMPDGTRIVDRGTPTYLLESQRGVWVVVEIVFPAQAGYKSICASWPRVAA